MRSDQSLESALQKNCDLGIIIPRFENNIYLKVSYKGTGKLVSQKWNIKIYTSGAVVCNDFVTLNKLINNELKPPSEALKLIKIDDAGIGFPALGVMVGVCDDVKLESGMVNVSYFKEDTFEKKLYLKEYSRLGLSILHDHFGTSPSTHRIEICTGHINTVLKTDLRNLGYDVRVVEIVGMLQDQLEIRFKEEIKKQIGLDLGYDPKGMKKNQIAKKYKYVLEEIRRLKPELLKSGWKSMMKVST